MTFLENVWWYLVLIGVMILIHELGHYWAARFFDVKVEAFSFGFGPRLFGFKHGETDFRFSAILFGGYVKMAGEQPTDDTAADPRGFLSKPRWQRMIIAFAGPAINIVLAVVLLAGLFMVHYEHLPNPHSPVIGYLKPDGAAAKAGIREGDQIVQVDNTADPTWEEIRLKELASAGRPMEVWVMRDGQRIHLTVTPSYDERQGIGYADWMEETQVRVSGFVNGVSAAQKAGIQPGDIFVSVNGQKLRSALRLNEAISQAAGKPVDLVYERNGEQRHAEVTATRHLVDGQERWMIGVSLAANVEVTKLPLPQAIAESFRQNLQGTKTIIQFLEGIVERRMSMKSLEGPIRIAQLSGEAAREGAVTFLGLMAAVSLNLAIFNLLPIPILDGGVMLMLFVEMLMRRDLDLKVKETVVKVGFVFLMMVVVFVIYNDISKILPPG